MTGTTVVYSVVSPAKVSAQGLLADCTEQDGNVNAAEIDAADHTA
jgi:hypothetical protein